MAIADPRGPCRNMGNAATTRHVPNTENAVWAPPPNQGASIGVKPYDHTTLSPNLSGRPYHNGMPDITASNFGWSAHSLAKPSTGRFLP